jgi:arylsulfatase A-like enzyme
MPLGRILDALDESGQLDNTLVIYIEGDNGASGEGTLQGITNEVGQLPVLSGPPNHAMRATRQLRFSFPGGEVVIWLRCYVTPLDSMRPPNP